MSVLLLAAGYLKSDPKNPSARVFAIIAVFVVFYLLSGMTGQNIDPSFRIDLSPISLLIRLGTSAISGLFMIYCFLVFQEQQRFPVTLAVALGLQVALDFILLLLNLSEQGSLSGGSALLATGLDIMQLVFVGFAMYWTLKGWRADLVDDRRVLRWFIIGVQGALIFSVVFVENFLLVGGAANNANEQAVIVYAIALLTLAMLLVAMRFDLVSLSYVIRKVAELTEEPEPEGSLTFDIESFNEAFREGQLYREAGLTISQLAKKLSIPRVPPAIFYPQAAWFSEFQRDAARVSDRGCESGIVE